MPQTLLLADDSATIQRVIELTFADEDITVVTVSDGEQAIARIESDPPDIVLADVGMAGKNGYEVAEYVKRTPKLAHIPVVLLTGAFEPVDQVKAAAVGCDAVLAKPFEPQLVIGRVRELLGRSASAGGNEPAAARQAPAPASILGLAPAPAAPAAPAVEVAAEPASSPRVEDYFDRLDAAFATFSHPAAAPVAAPPVPEELDWLRPKVEAPPDVAIADQLATEPAVAAKPAVVAEPVIAAAPAKSRVLPSLADAFGAILAAEQNALGVRPEWPAPSQPATVAAGNGEGNSEGNSEILITNDLVDRVARRVLEQLSDQVVRETVTSIASGVAERLVREEIERIQTSIK